MLYSIFEKLFVPKGTKKRKKGIGMQLEEEYRMESKTVLVGAPAEEELNPLDLLVLQILLLFLLLSNHLKKPLLILV